MGFDLQEFVDVGILFSAITLQNEKLSTLTYRNTVPVSVCMLVKQENSNRQYFPQSPESSVLLDSKKKKRKKNHVPKYYFSHYNNFEILSLDFTLIDSLFSCLYSIQFCLHKY